MKNKILLSLAIISCLAFTACGTNETVADSTSTSENIVSENSVSESTVSESSVSESTVAESDTIEPESSQQGTISGYEAPEDAVVDENTNPNDIGWGYEDEEAVEEVTEEVEEEPAEEVTEGRRNTVPEDEIGWYLENLHLTREEFDQKTDEELSALVMQWLEDMASQSNPSTGNTGGSTGGGNNSGGNEDDPNYDPWGDQSFGGNVSEDEVLPGTM